MADPKRKFTIHDLHACRRKTRYRTKERASLAAAMRRVADKTVPPLRQYECPCCGKWHNTSRALPETERPL